MFFFDMIVLVENSLVYDLNDKIICFLHLLSDMFNLFKKILQIAH